VALTISGVILLAVIVLLLLRNGYLRPLPTVAAVLLGFLLASTGIAPTIQSGLDGVSHAVSSIHT
jgi:hypothetical protein